MGTVCKIKFPEWRTNFVHWDYADALRDVFIAVTFSMMAHLSYLLAKGHRVLQALLSVSVGIFTCDAIEKYQHYKDLNFPVDTITKEDWIVMGITILITIYQYVSNGRKGR